jgi:hypothetical protein
LGIALKIFGKKDLGILFSLSMTIVQRIDFIGYHHKLEQVLPYMLVYGPPHALTYFLCSKMEVFSFFERHDTYNKYHIFKKAKRSKIKRTGSF